MDKNFNPADSAALEDCEAYLIPGKPWEVYQYCCCYYY